MNKSYIKTGTLCSCFNIACDLLLHVQCVGSTDGNVCVVPWNDIFLARSIQNSEFAKNACVCVCVYFFMAYTFPVLLMSAVAVTVFCLHLSWLPTFKICPWKTWLEHCSNLHAFQLKIISVCKAHGWPFHNHFHPNYGYQGSSDHGLFWYPHDGMFTVMLSVLKMFTQYLALVKRLPLRACHSIWY
jgi:hypothetical protein